MASKRIPKDWVFIQELYRSGYSLRQICDRYKKAFPSESLWPETIRKHANKHNWKRDLKPAIQEAVDRKLVEKTGSDDLTREGSKPRSDEQIVEDAAEAQAELILEHRQAGRNMRTLVQQFQNELMDSPTQVVIRKIKGGGNEQIEVPIPFKDRTAALRDLSMALVKAVDVERVSHNLNDRQYHGTGTIELVHTVPGAKPVSDGV